MKLEEVEECFPEVATPSYWEGGLAETRVHLVVTASMALVRKDQYGMQKLKG